MRRLGTVVAGIMLAVSSLAATGGVPRHAAQLLKRIRGGGKNTATQVPELRRELDALLAASSGADPLTRRRLQAASKALEAIANGLPLPPPDPDEGGEDSPNSADETISRRGIDSAGDASGSPEAARIVFDLSAALRREESVLGADPLDPVLELNALLGLPHGARSAKLVEKSAEWLRRIKETDKDGKKARRLAEALGRSLDARGRSVVSWLVHLSSARLIAVYRHADGGNFVDDFGPLRIVLAGAPPASRTGGGGGGARTGRSGGGAGRTRAKKKEEASSPKAGRKSTRASSRVGRGATAGGFGGERSDDGSGGGTRRRGAVAGDFSGKAFGGGAPSGRSRREKGDISQDSAGPAVRAARLSSARDRNGTASERRGDARGGRGGAPPRINSSTERGGVHPRRLAMADGEGGGSSARHGGDVSPGGGRARRATKGDYTSVGYPDADSPSGYKKAPRNKKKDALAGALSEGAGRRETGPQPDLSAGRSARSPLANESARADKGVVTAAVSDAPALHDAVAGDPVNIRPAIRPAVIAVPERSAADSAPASAPSQALGLLAVATAGVGMIGTGALGRRFDKIRG